MESCVLWAKQQLENSRDFAAEKLTDTEYSCVYRITSKDTAFYLKHCPEKFYIEPAIIKQLNQYGCGNCPEIIACNDTLHCFLSQSSGETTLKSSCESKLDGDLLMHGMRYYTTIQRMSECHIKQWSVLGLEDWRLNQFPSLYTALINQRAALIQAGLTKTEHSRLLALQPFVKKQCEILEQFAIPATISHCDFHPGNIIIDNTADHLTIIDWGETVISHPFFSLCGYLWNVKYWFKLNDDDDILKFCRHESIKAWRNCYDQSELLHILQLVNQLAGVYAALSYYQLHKYASLTSTTNKRNYLISVVECLQFFISSLRP